MPESGAITIVKRFTYRDQGEEWSNKYLFTGTKPTASGSWLTLANAIAAEEQKCFTDHTKFVRAYGYAPGSDVSEWQHNWEGPPDLAIFGNMATWAASSAAPGDAAMVVRWNTGRTSARGKRIYCRKYFHDVTMSTSDPDELGATQITRLAAYAAAMIAGSLPGGVKVSDNQGSTLTAPTVMPYITTRTLKRRGKRPPS